MQYVIDQLARLGGVAARKMFGEYSIYLDGKVIGFVADDQFFVKPTAAGETLLGRPEYGAPYPGAKPCFLITDDLDNCELLCRLAQVTANALPMPTPKPKPKPKAKPNGTKVATPAKVAKKVVEPTRQSPAGELPSKVTRRAAKNPSKAAARKRRPG